DPLVTGVQACALPSSERNHHFLVRREALGVRGGETGSRSGLSSSSPSRLPSYASRFNRSRFARTIAPIIATSRISEATSNGKRRSEERRVGTGARGVR